MNWEDEPYVRVYTRDTVTWNRLGWEGQCVLMQLFRKVDRAGCLEVGDDPAGDIADLVRMPIEVVKAGLAALLRVGTAKMASGVLSLPNFLPAQETRQSDKARQKASRATRAARAATGMSPGVTSGHQPSPVSHPVTACHPESPDVTLAQLSSAQLKNTPQPPKGEVDGDPQAVGPIPKKPDAHTQAAILLLGELSAARIRVDKTCRPLEPCEGNLKHIRARLRGGYTVEKLKHVIAVCEARAKVDSKSREYFDAVSPFRENNIGRWDAMTLEQARRGDPYLQRPPGLPQHEPERRVALPQSRILNGTATGPPPDMPTAEQLEQMRREAGL